VLTLALRITIVWTVLSVLFVSFCGLLMELGGRLRSKPAAQPSDGEDPELSAQLRAIYADSCTVFVAEQR